MFLLYLHTVCRKLENIDEQKEHKEYPYLNHPHITTPTLWCFITSNLFVLFGVFSILVVLENAYYFNFRLK